MISLASEPLNKSGPSRLAIRISRFEARIARNSQPIAKIRNNEAGYSGAKIPVHDLFQRFPRGVRRLLVASLSLGFSVAAQAEEMPVEGNELAQYGIFYERYEPSFYTGFAPRVQDPERLHLHVGRGNQLRVTQVLSDAVLEGYARDLQVRYLTYKDLIDTGKIELTQNEAFVVFEKALNDITLDTLVKEEQDLDSTELRERNLVLMEKLNPGRVFHIRIPLDTLIKRWSEEVSDADKHAMSLERHLELINLLLPTRLWVTTLNDTDAKALEALVALIARQSEVSTDELREPYLELLNRVSSGIYPVVDGHLQFDEFTAIHPVGTFNSYVKHKGRKIPQYPTPGRRALTYHQRTKTVDHIPDVEVYGFLPWIPYMHVGPRLHNSFHTLWWRMDPGKTDFLPDEIATSERAQKNGKPYKYLWLLSRGPMSHGCTHVNAGHISELREVLPAEPELMDDVDVFINKSHLFDVFDIDGDLAPEVMGVRYFIAYSLSQKRPHKLRAPTERRAYYDWLYGGELRYHEDGKGWFEDIRDAHFMDRKAVDGRRYGPIDLYEAPYEREKLQFYKMVDIPFARALRRVGEGHPFSPAD